VIEPGDVLRNRYRIEHSIGRGGMGEVFSAVVLVPPPGREGDEEATLLRPSVDSFRVAVKVVSRSVVTEAAMARLAREAAAAARIRSPFIPELIDVGTTPEGEVFLAMEILYGETLTAKLKAHPALSWDQVFLLGDDVLSGLIDAHEAGVVHRDLKPSNIFLCERKPPDQFERAKILDFGVCKLDTPDQEQLTGTGESVGTVSYMAPEQIRGASHVTVRADLYSFATVMFEALSGQLPHTGKGQMAMLASKLERNALRLEEAAQVAVPEGLDALLSRLLARDPNLRLASATEVREVWRALGPAVVAPRESAGLIEVENVPQPTETGLASGTIQIAPPRASRMGIALAAFAVTVSCVALVVLVWARVSTTPEPVVADFVAAPDPIVSASVVERPVVAARADDTADAAGPSDDASAVAPAASSPPRPATARPRGPWRPPPRGTTKPHIADKPRY